MLRVKNISEVIGKKVYTSDGDFFGVVEEVNLYDNRIEGWKIRVSGGYANSLGGARGVIIPHQFVKAIGDVFVINRGNLPGRDSAIDLESGEQEQTSESVGSEELI
jgi:sporulation protein YlmC with PRC-barrel domain